MPHGVLMPFLIVAFLVAFTAGAEAAINLNSSRSNNYKTAADCTKAGGTWWKGRDGLGCYLPLPPKPATGGTK